MKLKLSDLKSFKDNAAFVKTSTLLPILAYIKFDNGKVTKNNLGEFVTQSIDFEGQFLIEERILFGFIATASGDVDITIKKDKIILDDGFTKVSSIVGDFAHFPTNDLSEGEIELDPDLIDAVSTASKFINPAGDMEYMKYVYVGKGMVAGSDGFVAYIESFKDIPTIILNKDACAALSKLSTAKFSENKSYYFFESDGLRYGFSKPEQPLIDFTPYKTYEPGESFVCDRSQFIKFNDVALNSGQAKVLQATMSLNGGLQLDMQDADYGVDVSKKITASGEMSDTFNFNPLLMNKVLKSLSESQLKFTRADKKYYITGESNYLTLIMQMQ